MGHTPVDLLPLIYSRSRSRCTELLADDSTCRRDDQVIEQLFVVDMTAYTSTRLLRDARREVLASPSAAPPSRVSMNVERKHVNGCKSVSTGEQCSKQGSSKNKEIKNRKIYNAKKEKRKVWIHFLFIFHSNPMGFFVYSLFFHFPFEFNGFYFLLISFFDFLQY